ncbi:MAG TPA: aminodeoxychorismate synthase component I [Planctomycetota bacterium]|nr:aminodeoxychorismate synthase component I [Planctomycetota bacterium]
MDVTPLELPPRPWDAFLKLARLPGVIFLDSAAQDDARGRHSYIAASPFEVISMRGGEVRVEKPVTDDILEMRTSLEHVSRSDPFRTLAERLGPWKETQSEALPPFQGGAAGFFGYGLSRSIEKVPPPHWDEFETPDLVLGLHDWVLAFDHAEGTCSLVSQGFPGRTPEARRTRARRRTGEVMGLLLGAGMSMPDSPVPAPASPARPLAALAPSWPVPGPDGLRSNFSRDGYLRAVERAIEYIRSGDIFQVNLSQRLLFPSTAPPLETYRRLRERNPGPFAGYFDAGSLVIASSSPEQFLSLSGREIVTRPIKGTRPRGYTPEADSYGREALLESEKDRAENVMIVDLLRNDLSRVSKPHSVTVPRLFEAEKHPTVHHLVSEVRGEMRDGLDAMDLLRATFPGGSITGAPKVRAMEIIAELEPTARGPYCGSMGWIAFHGGMSLNILIRTVTIAGGWLQLPAGGGIVTLSNPEVEYQETLHKAEGMVRALV